ncbi:MAG: hypothetical protein K7J46_20385 [Bryobacter sp.]|nr:hypothetical protein [Bryobacter sp. CoA8 C33]
MSERVFSYLLRLYPRRFRDEYGASMRLVFQDRLRSEARISGRTVLWIAFVVDVLKSAVKEHLRPAPFPHTAHFTLSEDAVADMVRRSHAGHRDRMIMWLVAGFGAAWFGQAPAGPSYVVYGLLLLLALPAFRGFGRFKQHWRAYSLHLDFDRIDELSAGRVVRSVGRSEISRLLETPGFGLAVQSLEAARSIWIPSTVNGYEEIRTALEAWFPIERMESRSLHGLGHQSLFGLLSVYGAAILVRSQNVGAVLIAVCTYWLIRILWDLRSPLENTPIPYIRGAIALLLTGLALKASVLWHVL